MDRQHGRHSAAAVIQLYGQSRPGLIFSTSYCLILTPILAGKTFVASIPDQGRNLELSDRVPRAMRAGNAMDDIFVMIKERMASDGLSQPPLLVLPGMFLEKSQQMLNRANDINCPVRTCHLEQERRDELRTLKIALGKDFPQMNRTLAFYESMIASTRPSGRVPQLSFLRRASTDGRRDWGAVGVGQRPRGPKPHELQVVFHRARV